MTIILILIGIVIAMTAAIMRLGYVTRRDYDEDAPWPEPQNYTTRIINADFIETSNGDDKDV